MSKTYSPEAKELVFSRMETLGELDAAEMWLKIKDRIGGRETAKIREAYARKYDYGRRTGQDFAKHIAQRTPVVEMFYLVAKEGKASLSLLYQILPYCTLDISQKDVGEVFSELCDCHCIKWLSGSDYEWVSSESR